MVEEVVESTCAHAREATTPTAEGEGAEAMIGAWKPGAEDYELAKRLHDQGKPLVDVDALAARYRDKLTGRGFEACGLGRHTPAALHAGFRMWISREAEWRAHDPKPTHTPPRVEPKPNAHSWSDVAVRHLMAPYRSMFPAAGEGGGVVRRNHGTMRAKGSRACSTTAWANRRLPPTWPTNTTTRTPKTK